MMKPIANWVTVAPASITLEMIGCEMRLKTEECSSARKKLPAVIATIAAPAVVMAATSTPHTPIVPS